MAEWSEKEIRKLGTDIDRAIAKLLNRTETSVMNARQKRGIAPFQPHKRKWTKRELALLGTLSDLQIATKLGCTRKHVLEVRKRLGIATANPQSTPKKFRAGGK